MRTRIDAQWGRFGLAVFGWTDASLAGGTVKAIHVSELRTALGEAYTSAGFTPPTFSDEPLVAGTTVKVLHVHELRDAIELLEFPPSGGLVAL